MKHGRMEMTMNKVLMLCCALLAATFAGGQVQAADEAVALEFGGRNATEIRLPIGRSQIISSPVALEQVVIGSPDVADIKLLSAGRVLILGIKPGRTNLVFRQKGGDLVALMDVVVGYDLNGIKQKIFGVMPAESRLQVRDSNDRLILAGDVSSAYAMDMALNVARSYVPADKVVNLMQVSGGSQVQLEVRIAEVARNSLKELGINTFIQDAGTSIDPATGLPVPDFQMGTGAALASAPFGTAVWSPNNKGGLDALTLRLQALETKGLAKTLAEPTLVALSGQEANFLAGGEFPVPVAQSGTAAGGITVDYKEYGVGLRFTPTVLDASKINLKLVSEVSALTAQAFTIGSGTLPAITTRRAGTTVELADGQSFAIAGLMQSDASNSVNQVPLLGSIPVLGALFRSTNFQRNETELVIVVTARLVKPTTADQLALPTDTFTQPNDFDQYLLGWVEGGSSREDEKDEEEAGDDESPAEGSQGGIESPVGHQVNAENGHAQ